jgi:hypothetical protein
MFLIFRGWGLFSLQLGGEVVAEAVLGLAPGGVEAAGKIGCQFYTKI